MNDYREFLFEKRAEAMDDLRRWHGAAVLCAGLGVPCFCGAIYGVLTELDRVGLPGVILMGVGAAVFLGVYLAVIAPGIEEAKSDIEALSAENIDRLCERYKTQQIINAAVLVREHGGTVDPAIWSEYGCVVEGCD